MNRALLSLLRFGQPSAGFSVGLVILVVAFNAPRQSWPLVIWGAIMLLVWVVGNRWVFRVAMAVRKFRTCSGPRIILHFDPALTSTDLAAVEKLVETALDEQQTLFGFRLRRRLVVYLFSSHKSISKL